MLFKVKNYMSKNPVTVSPETSFKEIVDIMKEKKIGSVLVVDKDKRLKDIVTQSDLIMHLLHGNLEAKVKNFSKDKELITIDENSHVFDAVSYFEKYRIKHLPVLDSDNRLVGIITATDILKKVAGMGLLDPLTGLNNRNYYELLKQKYADKLLNLSVIMADIDDFKRINDRYGHLVGDKILSLVGKNLKRDLRAYDEVIRWGGEEFLVLLPRTTIKRAIAIAKRLKNRISSIKLDEFPEIKVSISMGISHYEGEGKYLDLAVNEADRALLNAKREGKDRINTGKFILNIVERSGRLAIEG
ncbi:diguanylate cyclase [Persephonella sp.]